MVILLSSIVDLACCDTRNLGKKASPAPETFSSLSPCIQNIATMALTLLGLNLVTGSLKENVNFQLLWNQQRYFIAATTNLGIDLPKFLENSFNILQTWVLWYSSITQ